MTESDMSAPEIVPLNTFPNSFTGTWDVAIESGNPADEILHVGQERNVDRIVMDTHGRTGLTHVLLGSVTEKVVRSAS